MSELFSRTELLLGKDAVTILNNSRVAVFGIGGVGGFTAEALARSGVGTIDVIDNDIVSASNINRQIYALHSTIGKAKVDVCADRMIDINPNVRINKFNLFYSPETKSMLNFDDYDYVVDAIDTVTGKISLVEQATASSTPIISSMGAGNKLDPCAFEVSDIYKTSVCPLAKVMRHELKKRGIKKLKVVYSKEIPVKPKEPFDSQVPQGKRQVPGSCAFVPSVVGLIIAGEVIKDIIGSRR